MKHEATRTLFDYWNRLRGARTAPERSEVEFAAIRHLLADMFMLEVDAEHRFPFVLSGTRVNALGCTEQKGCSFLELWAEPEQRAIAAVLLTVIDASCPVLATANAAPEDWPVHEIEILFLPLGRPGHERARILGLISPSAPPRWLGLRAVKNMSLASLHPVERESVTRRFEARTPFAPAAAPDTGTETKKPYLKILDGGRRTP